VNSAIAQQSEEMQLPLAAALHCLLEQWHLGQRFVCHHQIDFRDVHVHHAPSADVHVADFAVAHLPFRQTDGRPRSLNQGIRKILNEPVVVRLARKSDRVAFRFRAISPAIQYSQHNRFRSFTHFSSGIFVTIGKILSGQLASDQLLRQCCSELAQHAARRRIFPRRGVRSG